MENFRIYFKFATQALIRKNLLVFVNLEVIYSSVREWKVKLSFQFESTEKTEGKFSSLYHSQKKIGKWTIFFTVRGVFVNQSEF